VAKFADVTKKVGRIWTEFDANGDDKLTADELVRAQSVSDGKFSIASLDPGEASIISPGLLWNGFLACLILFFLYSIIDQMAKQKQAEKDEATLDEYEASLKKK